MVNFSSGGLDFGRGGGGDKRTQYLLMGGLALIFAGSVAFTLWYFLASHSVTVKLPTEYHMFCLNCNKEVIVPAATGLTIPSVRSMVATPAGPAGNTPGAPPADLPGSPQAIAPGTPPPTPPTASGPQKAVCPICGKVELIHERKCPKCKKYFVAEWDKTHGPSEPDPQAGALTCPNCGVNIEEYKTSHPGED